MEDKLFLTFHELFRIFFLFVSFFWEGGGREGGGREVAHRICHWLGKILSTGLSTLRSICNEVAMDFSSKLVIYPLTSVCIFSTLFSVHFLRC